MAGVDVIPAIGRRQLKQFVELPFQLYSADPYWTPPLRVAVRDLLDKNKHPFYADAEAEFFLACRGSRIVGRVAAILDRKHNRFQSEDAAFFGFFECADDEEAAGSLLSAARRWACGRGARVLRGPVNPSTNYECGMLVEGFASSPVIMMPYNPEYYPALMDSAGLRKAKDLYAYITPTAAIETGKIDRVAGRALAANGIRVRAIDMQRFQAEVEGIWEIYNSAWERNWGFVPMSRAEFMLMGKEMKPILKPELALVAEIGERVVGFALALPDINQALKHARGNLFPLGLLKILYYQRSIQTVRVLALGVVDEFRASGVAAAMYAELVRNGRRLGFQDCEMSWILEDNVLMNRSLAAMGARRYKTYRIYEMD